MSDFREGLSAAQVQMLMRRQRRTTLLMLVLLAPLLAFLAVTFHEYHLHHGHIGPLEERVERVECYLRIGPGRDTSNDFPFVESGRLALCGYPQGPFPPYDPVP